MHCNSFILLLVLVDGTSDDLDIPIKKVFADTDYVAKHNLCSINSINWARIMAQVNRILCLNLNLIEGVQNIIGRDKQGGGHNGQNY